MIRYGVDGNFLHRLSAGHLKIFVSSFFNMTKKLEQLVLAYHRGLLQYKFYRLEPIFIIFANGNQPLINDFQIRIFQVPGNLH